MGIKITDSDGFVTELPFVFMSHQPGFRDCQHKLLVWQEGDVHVYGLDFCVTDNYLYDVINFISENIGPRVTQWEVLDSIINYRSKDNAK